MPETKRSPQVSIVLPVFEEEKTIEDVIIEIVETLSNSLFTYEIVAVEDGSKDQSLAILRQLQAHYPGKIRVAHHTYNKGYGAALRTGIRIAQGDIVVCMDSDGQHTAKSIPEMLALIPQYDMVIGYRTENYLQFQNHGSNFRIPGDASGGSYSLPTVVPIRFLGFPDRYPGFLKSWIQPYIYTRACSPPGRW
jgi:glycosyltransferase involved in cell wall biosynthesis